MKNGLAASTFSLKKESSKTRSRIGSFDHLKPNLVQQVKLGLESRSKPMITAQTSFINRKQNNLFKVDRREPVATEGSSVVNENYFKGGKQMVRCSSRVSVGSH